jgi:Flp pilus assembly CpaE family ATPase
MDKITHTILLIDDDPNYASLVRGWIATGSGEIALVLNSTETLEAGLRKVAQGGVDLILLNLHLPDSSGLNTFMVTRANSPEVPIVVLTAGDTEAITLQTIREGAEDYLVKSKCGPELLIRVVESAIVRHKARTGKSGAGTSHRTGVIGVMGTGGGVGATTVACNFAAELRRQTREKVLLADLNLHAGMVSFMMGLTDTKFSIRDVVANLHRLDESCWEGMVTRSSAGLDILLSPDLMGVGDLPVDAISQVLDVIKPFYRWIVLDLGRLNAGSMGLLPSVDEILVVTTTAVSGVYGAIHVIDALKSLGFEGSRLSLILNQVGKVEPLSAREIDKLLGDQTAARLSAAPREMEKAFAQKELPGENSVFRRQIGILVRKVAGLPIPLSGQSFQPFLWLAQRFRRNGASAPGLGGLV